MSNVEENLTNMKRKNSIKNNFNIYNLGLFYISSSIIFEFIDQFAFLRLLGWNEIAQILMIIRIIFDILFIFSALYCGIYGHIFSGAVVVVLVILTSLGFIIGVVRGNDIFELMKDLCLFVLFIFKFSLFKQIFLYQVNLNLLFQILKKYCLYTLYVGILSLLIMTTLSYSGFLFYTQGISNIEWFVSYAITVNNPLSALFGLGIAFLLAKRMVVVSCIAILTYWFVIKLIKGNIIVFWLLCCASIAFITILPIISIDSESISYAIRFDYDKIFYELQNFSMDTMQQIIMTLDTPRYLESMSALNELRETGFWFGGGFGFEYLDIYTNEVMTNAHFSPVGVITKVGVFGMLLFYSLFVYGAAVGLRSQHPIARICAYYVLATIFGSLFAWKFFLSSPLLPMALAAAIHCRGHFRPIAIGIK